MTNRTRLWITIGALGICAAACFSMWLAGRQAHLDAQKTLRTDMHAYLWGIDALRPPEGLSVHDSEANLIQLSEGGIVSGGPFGFEISNSCDLKISPDRFDSLVKKDQLGNFMEDVVGDIAGQIVALIPEGCDSPSSVRLHGGGVHGLAATRVLKFRHGTTFITGAFTHEAKDPGRVTPLIRVEIVRVHWIQRDG